MPAPRHVMLNALFLDPASSGGPETYLRGLAPALADGHPKALLTIVTTRSGERVLKRDGWEDFCRVRSLPCEDGQRGRRQLAEQLLLPVLARRAGADLVHSLASVAPIRLPGVAHVVTVHDVTFFKRRTFNAVTTFGMRQVVSRAAHNADGLIAGAATARDEICEVLDLAPEDFAVVHHGVERPQQVAPAPQAEVRSRYALDGARVVLCLASKRPHKNQELLVRAAPLLDDDVVVVLAGHPEPYDRELRALARELGVEPRLRFADYVPHADLEALWALAGCAAFPTRAEGFGIPVVEAMAREVPVVASDLAVFREIAGDVPRYVDPDSPDQAAAAIGDALAAGDGDRARLERGRERAAGYTWAAAATGTWTAYERALERRGR